MDVDTKASKFAHVNFNLFFNGISAHIPKVLERRTSENFVNRPHEVVGYCHFGLIGRAKTRVEFSVFGPVERTSL